MSADWPDETANRPVETATVGWLDGMVDWAGNFVFHCPSAKQAPGPERGFYKKTKAQPGEPHWSTRNFSRVVHSMLSVVLVSASAISTCIRNKSAPPVSCGLIDYDKLVL